LKGDRLLEPTDALIVSQALIDPHSQHFLTNDNTMLGSGYVRNLEERMRNSGQRLNKLRFSERWRRRS